jgi:hypothetical protein
MTVRAVSRLLEFGCFSMFHFCCPSGLYLLPLVLPVFTADCPDCSEFGQTVVISALSTDSYMLVYLLSTYRTGVLQ